MRQLWLIVAREYTTRVRRRSFWLLTLLLPLFLLLLSALPAILSRVDDAPSSVLAVVDRTGAYLPHLRGDDQVRYELLPGDTPEAPLREALAGERYDGYLVVAGPADRDGCCRLCTEHALPLDVVQRVSHDLRQGLRADIVRRHSPGDETLRLLAALDTAEVRLDTLDLSGEGPARNSSAAVAALAALAAAMVIYTFVMVTGTMVLQSVVEEKQTRVAEVLVSVVPARSLLLGKIIGVGLVALTQLSVWLLCVCAAAPWLSHAVASAPSLPLSAAALAEGLDGLDVATLAACLVAYFTGGYLLYSSLFAVCGAALDGTGEGGQLQALVMTPLVAGALIALHTAAEPDSTLSVVASLVPFTSPIVMMARLPFGVPAGELAASLATLAVTFAASLVLAARIYRGGVLPRARRATLAELARWARGKE